MSGLVLLVVHFLSTCKISSIVIGLFKWDWWIFWSDIKEGWGDGLFSFSFKKSRLYISLLKYFSKYFPKWWAIKVKSVFKDELMERSILLCFFRPCNKRILFYIKWGIDLGTDFGGEVSPLLKRVIRLIWIGNELYRD